LRSFFYRVAQRLNAQRAPRDATLPIKTSARKQALSVEACAPNPCKSINTGNPFAEFSHEELVLAYINFSFMQDVEAIDLIVEMYDIDTYIDLTSFGISTRDFA